MKLFLVSPIAHKLFQPEQLEQLRSVGEIIVSEAVQSLEHVSGLMDGTGDRILAIDPDACNWTVENQTIKQIPNLKAIILQTTSFSWIDVVYAQSLGIPVIHLPGFSARAVAEWTAMTALALARKIPLIVKSDWKLSFENHQGYELKGKTVGVIGLGHVGVAVAENMQGLGMHVRYWSKQTRDDRFVFTELADLFCACDVLVMALARNEETIALISDDLLRSMKSNAIFIRTGFAPNHQLLLDLVKDGLLYGYGFEEDVPTFNAYKGNIWSTPHLAWLTHESIQRNGEMWTEAIVNAVKGEFHNRVN